MATAMETYCIEQIGETAGQIWNVLAQEGPQPIAKLVKQVDAPKDVVMQGIGWLAREGKIAIDEESRSRRIIRLV